MGNNKMRKRARLIIGIILGLILGGAFGLFIANPALTILLLFLGIIKGDSGPPWVGTLITFTIFLSINMGIYIGIKWSRKSQDHKTKHDGAEISN
jgi:uncharacterized RDD family membrane protein YckC